MMKKQVKEAVCDLEKILRTQKELTDQLLTYGKKEEAALIANSLDGLREAIERQEEISLKLAEQERLRIQKAQMLTAFLGISRPNASLNEIEASLSDPELAEQLDRTGKALAESVRGTQVENNTVKEILSLKSDYTNTMLRLLTGGGDSRNQSYDMHGGIKAYNEDGGIYEVLI